MAFKRKRSDVFSLKMPHCVMLVPTRKRVREAGAVPEPQKIITSHHFILGSPHPRRGRSRKNNAGASPPHFWVAPPRKGVGPAQMRRREGLFSCVTREPPPFSCGDIMAGPPCSGHLLIGQFSTFQNNKKIYIVDSFMRKPDHPEGLCGV